MPRLDFHCWQSVALKSCPTRSACVALALLWTAASGQAQACSVEDQLNCGSSAGLAATDVAKAQDFDFVCVTVARDGAFGVGVDASFATALSATVRHCKQMSGSSSGCGAQFEITRGRWTVATRCADQAIIVTSERLADALQQTLYAEIGLERSFGVPLPKCSHLVTVDPSGRISLPGRVSLGR